jgi:hypothetical protein
MNSNTGADLFGFAPSPQAHARRDDIDTSNAAAEEITPHIRELQAKVLEYARSRGCDGFTDLDLNRHFSTTSSTYRTRRSELVGKGLVEDSGNRVCIGQGRRHALWRVTDKGLAA